LALEERVVPSSGLAISQVYAAGNSGGAFNSDFVEIFNRGSVPVPLTGKSLQYQAPFGGPAQVTILSGSIQPGQYYLVRGATGGPGAPLPTPDAAGSIDLGMAGGTVALLDGTTPLTGPPSGPSVFDSVGYGPGSFFEGAGPAPVPYTVALFRQGGGWADTDNNAADFGNGQPAPRNTQSPLNLPSVALTAVAPTVPELGPGTGQFTLSRSGGDLSAALTVTVTVAGSAVPGTNYTGLAAGAQAVTFAPNQATVALTFAPVDDGVADGDETVTASLSAGPNYQVGAQGDATVTITEKPAQDHSYTVLHDNALSVAADQGVLADATPPPGQTPTAVLDQGPAHGTLVLNPDGSFDLDPLAGYTGDDSFTFHFTAGSFTSNTATVSLFISDNAPFGDVPAYYLHAGTPLSVTDPGLLSFVSDADPEDAGSLTVELVPGQGPAHAASFTLRPDGTFDETPEAGFTGTDQFAVRVSDGALKSDPITVTLVVENDPPQSVDDEYYVGTNGTLTASQTNVLVNDYDPDGDPLTVSLAVAPDAENVSAFALNSNGTFSLTPAEGVTGDITFGYRASDGTTTGDLTTVTVHVVDHAVELPTAYLLDGTNTLAVGPDNGLLAHVFDPSGGTEGPLRVKLLSGPPEGSGNLVLNDLRPDGTFDGTFSFTPSDPTITSVDFTCGIVVGNEEVMPAVVRLRQQALLAGGKGVQLQTVTFEHTAADNSLYVEPDPAGQAQRPYNTAQWKDNNGDGVIQANQGDHAQPVAYVRGTKMTVRATFKVDPVVMPLLQSSLAKDPPYRLSVIGTPKDANNGTYLGGLFWAPDVDGNNADRLVLDPKKGTLTVREIVAKADPPLPNQVEATDLALQWDLNLVTGGIFDGTSFDVGTSTNPLYVTWKTPPANFHLYHTLLDLSTHAAQKLWDNPNNDTEAQTEQKLPGAVFEAFRNQNVTRVDGTPLKYYGSWETSSQTTTELLKDADGQCPSWVGFYLDSLKAQGLFGYQNDKVIVRSKYFAAGEFFLVKDWSFIANPAAAHKYQAETPDPANPGQKVTLVYPYQDLFDPGDTMVPVADVRGILMASRAANAWQFPNNPGSQSPDVDGNKNANGQARTGLKGQNSPTPVSMFTNHVLAQIGGVLYDPSYGVKYEQAQEDDRLKALSAAAIEGYAVQLPVGARLAKPYRLQVRQNVAGDGLTITERKSY
jgi:hypothetical protein